MDVDHLLVDQSPVTLLWVLLGGVTEEAAADGFLHSDSGLAAGDHVQLVSGKRIKKEGTMCTLPKVLPSRMPMGRGSLDLRTSTMNLSPAWSEQYREIQMEA